MEKTYSFQKLADFVWDFAIKHRLLTKGDQVVIGLSAGVDSRLLLELALCWRQCGLLSSLRAAHFNHKVRLESEQEEDFVKKLAASLDVELVCGHNLLSHSSELALRNSRYNFFEHTLRDHEQLLLAHHLDDSLEWSLRQSVRSSEARAILGMPAKSGRIRRPLMCLSKEQIEYAAMQFELEYCHDSSNDCLHYERNFIRHEIVPKLKSLGAGALKNYVHRSNQLAHSFGLHLLNSSSGPAPVKTAPYLEIFQRPFVHYMLTWKGDFPSLMASKLVREILCELSEKKRGMWRDQIEKLSSCALHKKWAGPLSFSGGVRAIVCPGRILFYHQDSESEIQAGLNLFAGEGAKSWLFRYRLIDFNDYPKVPRDHILSKWSGIPKGEVLVTREQIQTLPLGKQRAFMPRPIF